MKKELVRELYLSSFQSPQNTKIFPSKLVAFTLVKEPERSTSQGRLSLFHTDWPYLRKMTFWSLLSHFRLSKHETTNEFDFIGLTKLHAERPYLGMNPSFLRFVKNMRMDSSLDELQ